MGKNGIRYTPASLVSARYSSFVPSLMAVTLTCGTAPPPGSTTVPVIVAVYVWARSLAGARQTSKTSPVDRKRRDVLMGSSSRLANHGAADVPSQEIRWWSRISVARTGTGVSGGFCAHESPIIRQVAGRLPAGRSTPELRDIAGVARRFTLPADRRQRHAWSVSRTSRLPVFRHVRGHDDGRRGRSRRARDDGAGHALADRRRDDERCL